MYRIRLHGRGGQGIKTAARILGSALFARGFEVQDAPRYGAERRGAPIFTYVRADRSPIRERSTIETPDLVAVADPSLLSLPAAGVTAGLRDGSVVLVCGESRADLDAPLQALRERHPGAAFVVHTHSEEDRSAGIPAGIAVAGAAAQLLGFIDRATLEEAVRAESESLGEGQVRASADAALRAFDAQATNAGIVTEGSTPTEVPAPDWLQLRFDEVKRAAPDIHAQLTSVQVRTGLWRTLRPVIDYDHCHRCSWICGPVCPDSAIVTRAGGAPEIDLEHCKGCMICVAVCPNHAIHGEPESVFAGKEGAS